MKSSLKQQAYTSLKNKLIRCEYTPGSIMNEADLCNDLKISRTPIREAVIQLEMENWLKVIPKKGIQVPPITIDQVMQIFDTRKAIEPLTLKMGFKYIQDDMLLQLKEQFSMPEGAKMESYQLDTAMHLYFIERCGNPFIIEMMHKVFERNTRIIISSPSNESHIHESRSEHLKILQLALEKKADEAAQALPIHIDHCRSAALDSVYASLRADSVDTNYRSYIASYFSE